MPYTPVMYSSATELWTTPQAFYDALHKEFDFTLDAAATAENAKCPHFYTAEDDALTKNWGRDERVFLNCPYGKPLPRWIEKAWSECRDHGALVVMLIPARTDTAIWHSVIFPHATEIRYIKGRLKFGGQKNSAPFPSAVVIFRP